MQKSIKHRYNFNHDPETVWEYLTNSELLAQWLMPNDFQPILGHKFQFGTKPKIKLGFDGRVYCEVIEIIPFKKLAYTWKGGMSGKNTLLDTTVTWTLEPTENGTLLTLEQTGFKSISNIIPHFIMNKGWIKIGKRLQTTMEKSKEKRESNG